MNNWITCGYSIIFQIHATAYALLCAFFLADNDPDGVIKMAPYLEGSTDSQKWVFAGDMIYNLADKSHCIDVKYGFETAGTSVISFPCHNEVNQQWRRDIVKY